MDKKRILCTFVKGNKVLQAYETIMSGYKINRKITLYKCKDNHEYIYIFDICDIVHECNDTISLHKKTTTNTYYTINALNEIIKQRNNGNLDPNFKIDWEQFENCILLYNNKDGLKIYNIQFIDQLNFE